jgi:membrane-associated phospholipid phosphatase
LNLFCAGRRASPADNPYFYRFSTACMKKLGRTFSQNPLYFILLGCGLAAALLMLLVTGGKVNSFLAINRYHAALADPFLTFFTWVGDGLFSILVAVVFFFFPRFRSLSIYILISFLLSGLLVQVLKHLFTEARPREIISATDYHHFLDDSSKGFDSFPSGHTTSIFSLATLLCLYFPDRLRTFLFFLVAVLVGYSRIYLGNHFLTDVMAGACLGTVTALLIYTFLKLPIRLVSQRRKVGKDAKA